MRISIALAVSGLLFACGAPREAPRVQQLVRTDASRIEPVETDLGYTVTTTEARVMVRDFEFTVHGESHEASLWRGLTNLLVGTALAHPGHLENGDITGELAGRFLLDWLPGEQQKLGKGTFIVGSYEGANFTFARADEDDGIDEEDPLFGHTAVFRGEATKGEETVLFTFVFDSPEDRELIGLPFEFQIEEDTAATVNVQFLPLDPFEEDTFFDGVDFLSLDRDGDGELIIDPSVDEKELIGVYNLLHRTFQTHDHYDVILSPNSEK